MKQIKKLIAKILLVTFFFQIFGGVNFSQASGNTRPADINVTSYNIPFDPNNPPTGEVAIGKIQAEPGVSYKIFLGKGIGGKDSEEVHYCQPITPEDISAKLNANNEIVIGSINNNRYYYYLAIIGTNGNGGSIVKSFNLGIGYYYNNNHSIRIFKNNDTSIAFGYRSLHNDCFMQAIDITGAEKIIEPNPNRNPEAYQDSYIKGSVGDDYTNRYYKYRKVIKQGEKINLADFTLKKAIDRPGYFDLSNIVNPQKSVDIVDPDGNILTDEQVKNYDFSTPGNYTFNYKSSFFDANNIGYGGFSTINQYQILVNPILKTTCTAGTPIKNGKFEIATLGDASNTYILAQDDIDAGYSIVGNKLYRNQKVDTEGTRNLSVEIRSPNYKVHSPTYYDENLVEGIVKNGENYENITGYKNGTGTPYTPLYEEYHKWLGCDWDGDGVTDATTWDDCSGAAAHAPYYEDVYDTSKVLYRLRTDITTLYPEKKVLLEGYTEGLSTENLKINEVCPTAPTVFTATKDFTATENVQRDNCAENFTGTSVDVSVTLSATATGATQTEADNLALAEAKKLAQTKLAEVKQSQANINGQCIQTTFEATKTVEKSQDFTRNNCDDGFAGGVVNVSKSATATATGTTQTEADNLALEKATQKAKKLLADEGQDEANTNGTCTQVIFDGTGTFTASGQVVKNDCPEKFTASGSVLYELPKTATATGSSQAEADKLALQKAQNLAETEFENTKQDYANEHGICKQVIFDGTGSFTKTGSFVRNNCETGKYGTAVEFSKTETATATGGSQDEANNLALAEATRLANLNFDTQGQAFANENGTCSDVERICKDTQATNFSDKIADGVKVVEDESVCEYKTTKWLDENNEELKSSETGKTFGEQGVFDGYEFVNEETNGDEKIYKFKKIIKTTKWVDENGVELKGSETGTGFGEVGSFDGYTFKEVNTSADGKTKTYIFKQIEKVTKWLDENNEELKSSETGKTFGDKGSFDGYEFVSEEVNGDEKIYKFKKIIKTTKWVDENNEELKSSETGKTFGEQGSFDGYTFKEVNTSADGKIKTYIFKQIEKVTKWLDENNEELKSSETGKTFGEQGVFDGYEFVNEETNGDEKIYKFKKIIKTTKWVDENGVELKSSETGKTFGEQGSFDGYELISEGVSDDGHTKTYVFRKKPSPKPTKPKPVVKTTKWVDENGVELKDISTGETFGEQGVFDGYEFMSEEVNGDEKVYKFKKIMKTTKWLDENNEELKSSETGKDFRDKGSFDGYEFISAETNGDEKVYKFKKKAEPKPVVKTTKWVSENGVELKDISTGETFGESGHFSGYTLKKVILSDDKNTKTYIFEKKKEEVKPHPEPEQKPEYTTTTGHGGGYDPKKKADYAFNGSVLKEVFGFGKEDKTEEKEVVEEKEEGRVEFFPNVIQGESEFVKYPSELPQMGNKLQELIYDRAGIIPLRFRGLLEVRLPSKEVFRLAGSENSDLDFWLDVVPEEDRNKDKYIVLPTQGLVMPINTVDKTEQAYSDFINGENQNFNNFMHDGAIEIPGTSTRGYGEVGNKMIAGHSSYWYSGSTRYKTHFQKIIGMEEGEEIWVYERDAWSGEFKRYVYRVHSSYNTSKYDVDVLKPVDTKQLTLMTCTPIGGISGRWIVKGEFVGN